MNFVYLLAFSAKTHFHLPTTLNGGMKEENKTLAAFEILFDFCYTIRIYC